jgi:hypothetical protein
MYLVEREIKHDDKHYLEIRISTACCKRQYLVEVHDNGYYDIENLTMVPAGARKSIDIALEYFRKQNPK